RLRRYFGPIRHPTWPRLSLTGCELTVKRGHRVGFPVLLGSSPCCLPSPMTRQDQAEASSFARYPGCAIPQHDAGSAPASPVFGACSVFTPVTACELAESLKRPFSTKGFDGFVTSTATSAAYRLERQSCRVGLAPTG